MATLDEFGREVLDQTPVAVPFKVTREEPIHLRMRRLALQAVAQIQGDDVETLEDANDFEVPDDPSSYDSQYTEPDYAPHLPVQALQGNDFTPEEVEAAKKAIEELRSAKGDAVSSAAPDGATAGAQAPAAPAAAQS